MSGDLLQVGLLGYLAKQRHLLTTANNIENANTDGYSRQTAIFEARQVVNANEVTPGSGVRISSITRSVDQFVMDQLRDNTSDHSKEESFLEEAKLVDSLLSDPNMSISNIMESFFDGLQQVNDAPEDITTREALLTISDQLITSFNNAHNMLTDQIDNINIQLEGITTDISTFSSELASLNLEISNQLNPSNSLLDKRDERLRQLSELIGIKTVINADETVNVFIATGESLVTGGVNFPMSTEINSSDSQKRDVVFTIGGSTRDVTDSITGGKLAGLLDVQTDVIDLAIRRLNRIALAFADDFNTQHLRGMDLNNTHSLNYFADVNSTSAISNRILASNDNSGSSVMSLTINDTNTIKADEYTLLFPTTTSYTITNNRTGISTAGTISGVPDTITHDGFTININSGSLAANDVFTVVPTRNAALNISRQITSASQIAIASPVVSGANISNSGNGAIQQPVVTDITNAAFTTTSGAITPPINIVFTSATTYNIVNATSGATLESVTGFVPNSTNAVFPSTGGLNYGYTVNITGAPASGDTFTINYNTNGFSDNRNGHLMVATQTTKNIDTSTKTFQQDFADLVGTIGSKTRQAIFSEESAAAILERVTLRRDSVSGVNSNEEAANLVRMQQSIEASAQVIAVAKDIFATILQALRS